MPFSSFENGRFALQDFSGFIGSKHNTSTLLSELSCPGQELDEIMNPEDLISIVDDLSVS